MGIPLGPPRNGEGDRQPKAGGGGVAPPRNGEGDRPQGGGGGGKWDARTKGANRRCGDKTVGYSTERRSHSRSSFDAAAIVRAWKLRALARIGVINVVFDTNFDHIVI